MKGNSQYQILLFIVVFFLSINTAKAQILAPAFPADSTYMNAISLGTDYGLNLDRSADHWGFTLAYARKLNSSWVLSGGVTFVNEMERVDDKDVHLNTFSGVGKVSYYLTKRWTLTTGLSKGFANNINSSNSMKTTDGDWSTGLTIGADVPEAAFWEHDIYALSVSYLYNISNGESVISLGIVIGGGW